MIEIKNLTKIYGEAEKASGQTVALQNVNLSIEKGDVFGIIGMSGAGKSTLLRCLCMLETPTQGQILLNGQFLGALQGEARRAAHRQMGVVFQGYHLLMQKNVEQNIAFPLTLVPHNKADVQARVQELLQLVGLTDKAKAYPSQLSGGQKQRVALARALATNPAVLLCDEPTSALDSLTTKSVLALLKDINQNLGVTIVIITHEIAVVKSICNKVAVIDESQFVEVGSKKEIFENPKSDITKLLLGKGGSTNE
ncbi:ATP-binding cassette domain-containing protein [Ruminococcaceae bacterium OttesenSCG-928-A16]|nr:ATP-binding cassette domain-containing protein [Ruminococcaceae bacterium OttesenSCG-928-A16]